MFSAFVAAGAISKANADDPAKSSLVRCARTDKGVHAAGNVISLKLIVEDPDIVQKINEKLAPQIRVWGIERTNGSFSAYQFCDSRIYEYLIPTYCFLPPHPRSFLGRKIVELAEEADDLAAYKQRQGDALSLWEDWERSVIDPIFAGQDKELSAEVLKIFYETNLSTSEADLEQVEKLRRFSIGLGFGNAENTNLRDETAQQAEQVAPKQDVDGTAQGPRPHQREREPLNLLLRHLKDQQLKAKKAYRIHPDRLARVRSAFSRFVGSYRFHNYTIDKDFRDPSAKRVIKSFVADSDPIIINDTEWLSLKVHGQSFMMHQIRKMVSMAALVVRCGTHEGRIQDTYLEQHLSIPKAPSLGLLLERPVFDSYNKKLQDLGRRPIDFSSYDREIQEFKQKHIYERMFEVEDQENTFHVFFASLDQARSAQLLFLSSVGLEATKRKIDGPTKHGGSAQADTASASLTNDADGQNAELDGVKAGKSADTQVNVEEIFADDDGDEDQAES